MRVTSLLVGLSFSACVLTGQSLAGSCVPAGSVPELPGEYLHGWLTPLDAAAARAFLQSFSRGKSYWDGNSLKTSCRLDDGEEIAETTAAEVDGGSTELPFAQGQGEGPRFFTDLALRTGHTRQEGEAMAKRYANLGFFRELDDGNGGTQSEAQMIYDRHAQALGMGAADLQSAKQLDEGKMKELAAKVEAAQQRGDMNEMMRLAMELQKITQPIQEEVAAITTNNDQLTWRLLEEAYPDLSAVAYKTRVVLYDSLCLKCSGTP